MAPTLIHSSRPARVLTALVILAVMALARPAQAAQAQWTRDDAAHLIRRAGFGGTPDQIDRLHALGKPAAVEYLISGKLPAGAKAVFDPVLLLPFKSDPDAEGKDALPRVRGLEVRRMRSWWIDRMVRTDHPLEEKMSLFWHGLFCSGLREVKSPAYIIEQNLLFHVQATGNYKQLAHAILHDPAMLRYLNADQNITGKPNENLARELMELFTMGEGNGYTERDIAEVARALTGAGVNPLTGYQFRPFRHDNGMKTIFGQSGNYRPDDVVDLIFSRPQPAQYLAKRLWTFYAYAEPGPGELTPIVGALKSNNYELRPALRALFMSDAFYSEKAKFAVIKSPADLIVGTFRALDIKPTEVSMFRCVAALNDMNQDLYQPPNVRGWPGGEHWITSSTLYARYNQISSIVEGNLGAEPAKVSELLKLSKGATPQEAVDKAIAHLLGRPLHPDKRQALIDNLGKTLNIGREETERRLRTMVALLLSTPEYQVE